MAIADTFAAPLERLGEYRDQPFGEHDSGVFDTQGD
jgi:hypothetical protein